MKSSSAMLPRLQGKAPVNRWDELQQASDLAGVQDLIREAIRAGTIRVVPGAEGRVRIIPGPSAAQAQAAARDGLDRARPWHYA